MMPSELESVQALGQWCYCGGCDCVEEWACADRKVGAGVFGSARATIRMGAMLRGQPSPKPNAVTDRHLTVCRRDNSRNYAGRQANPQWCDADGLVNCYLAPGGRKIIIINSIAKHEAYNDE